MPHVSSPTNQLSVLVFLDWQCNAPLVVRTSVVATYKPRCLPSHQRCTAPVITAQFKCYPVRSTAVFRWTPTLKNSSHDLCQSVNTVRYPVAQSHWFSFSIYFYCSPEVLLRCLDPVDHPTPACFCCHCQYRQPVQSFFSCILLALVITSTRNYEQFRLKVFCRLQLAD